MPLARIITRFPKHTGALCQQLQLEGYEVEIAAPEELHSLPADLEIDFALCNPAEALEQASRRAAELDADVVVAPGVLELAMQRAAAPVESQVEAKIEAQPEPEPIPVEMASTEAIPSEPVMMQPVEEDLDHELPSYNPHFARNLGAQLRETLTGLGAAVVELRKRLAGHLRTAASSIAARAVEYQAQIKQRAAERQAAREQQRAELAKLRQAETQVPPVVNLPLQDQLEPPIVPEPQPVLAVPIVQESPAPVRSFTPVPRQDVVRKRRTPLQLRGIFTGAVAASILFIVGLVLANIHQQSPLPPHMTQTSIEQHVPFGAIIVRGTPTHANVPATAPPPAAAALAPMPSSSTSSQATSRKKPHPFQRRASVREEDDVTADDVTVRHFPSSPPKRPVQQQAKFKRYSDMN